MVEENYSLPVCRRGKGVRETKNTIAKELRKNAGIIASEKNGQKIRNSLSDSLEALAVLIEDEELPIKKMVSVYYLRGILTGIGIALAVLAILLMILLLG